MQENVQQAYDSWAAQYDTNDNRTRDLEGRALRQTLASLSFSRCLEIGCGTGKNTVWLAERAGAVTAVDFSEAMLEKAREKLHSPAVQFVQADIKADWYFAEPGSFDLVVFSLVLEHIAGLGPVFEKAAAALRPGGHVYLGELHPFKQYLGSKARFETGEGTQVVTCFNHSVSEFVQAAFRAGFTMEDLQECYDEGETMLPRLLVLLLKKK